MAQNGSGPGPDLAKAPSGGIRLTLPGQAARSPANVGVSSPLAGTHKRPNPDGNVVGTGKKKKAKTAGTRSASPMPARPTDDGAQEAVRSGPPPVRKDARARTEG